MAGTELLARSGWHEIAGTGCRILGDAWREGEYTPLGLGAAGLGLAAGAGLAGPRGDDHKIYDMEGLGCGTRPRGLYATRTGRNGNDDQADYFNGTFCRARAHNFVRV